LATFKRLPTQKEVTPVYAVIVIMIYGWTILKFNYFMTGWLYFLNIGEIVNVFTYAMTVNLLESLVVLLGVATIGFILPRKWFADAFVARGAGFSVLILALLMYVAEQFEAKDYYPADIIRWFPFILFLMLLFVYILGRVQVTRKAIEFFADRAIIFLYVSLPLSGVSLVAVLLRNVF
jgi:hypothetical protein